MPRFKLTVEYDGTGLVGWQRQDNGPSVQAMLEAAAAALTGQATIMHAAGRTDAGVHASGQVAHFETGRDFRADTVRDALNFWLREQARLAGRDLAVTVLDAGRAADDFHARFSATGRHYLYRILDRRAPPVLDARRVWWVGRALDAEAMAEAAKLLVGRHDFTTFRAKECQAASPVKTLDRLDVLRVGAEIHIVAAARSFLHHQMRNFAGSLAQVGNGRWKSADLGAALDARDRARGGPTAPPQGLCLTGVDYDPDQESVR